MKGERGRATVRLIAALHVTIGGLFVMAPVALMFSLGRWITGPAFFQLVSRNVVSAALVGVAIWALERTSRKKGALKYGVGLGLGFLLCMAVIAGAISLYAASAAVGVWLITLGVRIARHRTGIYETALVTHQLLLVFGVIFAGLGAWMLGAAELSARQGGGLLGAFGLIPISLGGLVLTLSLPSLLWLRTEAARSLLS